MEAYKRFGNYLLNAKEQKMIHVLAPDYYVSKGIHETNIGNRYLLRFVRTQLHDVTQSFVNGGFSYKGFALFPLVKDVSAANRHSLRLILKALKILHTNGFDFARSTRHLADLSSNYSIARAIGTIHKDLFAIKGKGKRIVKDSCEAFSFSDYPADDSTYLNPLKELRRYVSTHIAQYVSGFYVHGSFGTGDYVKDWSDLDTACILSKETVDQPSDLIALRSHMYKLRRFYYLFDPLQHHGSITLNEYEFSCYYEPYFPLTLFPYAKSLLKHDPKQKVILSKGNGAAIPRFFWFVNFFRNEMQRKNPTYTSYDAKNLLHYAMLFPSIYLNALNVYVYKKDSFGVARQDFNHSLWDIMDHVSIIRERYKPYPVLPLVKLKAHINPVLAYHLNSSILDRYSHVEQINRINCLKIVQEMHQLLEHAFTRVKRDVLET